MTLTAKTLIFISTLVFISTPPPPTVIETRDIRPSVRRNIEHMILITEIDILKLEYKVDSILVAKIDTPYTKIIEHDTTEAN